MNTFLTIVHIIVCVFLILVVLLQAGKGGGMGIAFGGGGGSQTVFGSSGAGNFLTRLTSITAVIFMVTSLVLAHNSSQQDSKRLQRLEGKKAAEQEVEKARLDKLKSEIEKSAASKAGQSAAPTAPAGGAAGAPAAMPALPLTHPPLKLTAPKLTDEPAGKGPGAGNAKGATKPESSASPAKDGTAAPGEKPAKRRKKAPAAGGDTSAAPPPAPPAAPPPAE
jgi:preprotein translocase subunit SecG